MDAEIVTLAAAWTSHATYGLGAQLATLALVGSDSRPATPTLVTERSNGAVARWHTPDVAAAPDNSLLLAVAGGDPVEQGITEAVVESIAYRLVYTTVHRTVHTHTAAAHASYILRALKKSWLAFNTPGTTTASDVTLNGVTIVGVRGFLAQRRLAEPEDHAVLHDCVVTLHVIDDPTTE